MVEFINRERELRALENFWKGKEPQLIIIYGKRRIGKTELIKQFMKNKPHIYFLAQRINEHEILKLLGETVGEFFDDDILKRNGFGQWKWFFEYLKKHIKKRIIVAFDEFPYLAEATKGISSVFQAGWDEYLKDTPVFFILCGSSISMMEEKLLAYKAPLYGRRSGQIFLKPFPFSTVRKFYPGLSFEDCLNFYAIAGGNPSYLKRFSPEFSLERNLRDNLLQPEAYLYNEVEFILREELREPRNYLAILKAIALSKNRVSEIVNETGLEKGILHKYLYILEDLHLIQKEVPVTEKVPLKSRKGIYVLQDQFFKFWLKYFIPNKSSLEEGKVDLVIKKIKSNFNELVAGNYEKVAREIVRDHEAKLFTVSKIGKWWKKNEEIDVVAVNEEEKKILFGEVKWRNKPIGVNIYEDLKRKSQLVEWGRGRRREYFCLFSKSGFTDNMKERAGNENIFLFHKERLVEL